MSKLRAEVLPVGPPVPPEFAIGREGDVARLVAQLQARDRMILAGERRTGKTTVALAALAKLAERGWDVCAVDCSRTSGPDGLAEAIASERRENRALVARRAAGAGERIARVWRTLGTGDAERDPAERAVDAVAEMATGHLGSPADEMDRLVKAAGDAGAVVFFDEAHHLAELPDADLAGFRGLLAQAGTNGPAWLFASSEESAADQLFGDGGLLELHGLEFPLPPIPPPSWHEGLRVRFRELGTEISHDAVEIILDASNGHPYRTMLCANRAHELAVHQQETSVDSAIAATAVADAQNRRQWRLR